MYIVHPNKNSLDSDIYNGPEDLNEIYMNDIIGLDCDLQDNIAIDTIIRKLHNIAAQAKSGDTITSFMSLIDTNKKLNTMTGINSFNILNEIIDLHKIYFPDIEKHRLSLKERIVMVFVKFKQGLSFSILCVLFNDLTAETCRSTYISLIPQLSYIFKCLIYWPSKQEISTNIFHCFDQLNTDVHVVLYCTEVSLQKLKCLTCRIECCYPYKSNYALKFLVGISPAGLIAYISKPYGAMFSDKAIFEQNNLIKLMQKPNAYMEDKGFSIDNIYKKNDITMIKPHFYKNQKQFSVEDAVLENKMAKAKVHIKKINQHIKTFKIFNHIFPDAHLHLASDIMTIICGLYNICPPFFSSDKFNS